MIDTTFDLFVDLGATDEQCDFPVVYASGANGVAGDAPETLAETLEPLFECIVREACLSRQCLPRPVSHIPALLPCTLNCSSDWTPEQSHAILLKLRSGLPSRHS